MIFIFKSLFVSINSKFIRIFKVSFKFDIKLGGNVNQITRFLNWGHLRLNLYMLFFLMQKRYVNVFFLYITVCTVIAADTRQMAFVRPGEQELTQSSTHPPFIPLFSLNVSHINRFCCCLKWAQN